MDPLALEVGRDFGAHKLAVPRVLDFDLRARDAGIGVQKADRFLVAEAAARPAVYLCAAPEFATETNRYLHMFNPKRMDEKCYSASEGERLWQRTLELLDAVGAGTPA